MQALVLLILTEILDLSFADKPRSINVALDTILEFDKKNNAADIQFIDNIQNFLNKLKSVIDTNKNHRRSLQSADIKFTDFLENVVEILINFDDKDLEDVFAVIDSETRKYHYKGCKFYELLENNEVRRFLAQKLDRMSDKPGKMIKNDLKHALKSLKDDDFDDAEGYLLDYLNSLYKNNASDKFRAFLNNLELYSNKYKRTNLDLVKIIRQGVREIIFDYYSTLNTNARRDFKIKIEAFWKHINEPNKTSHRVWSINYTTYVKNKKITSNVFNSKNYNNNYNKVTPYAFNNDRHSVVTNKMTDENENINKIKNSKHSYELTTHDDDKPNKSRYEIKIIGENPKTKIKTGEELLSRDSDLNFSDEAIKTSTEFENKESIEYKDYSLIHNTDNTKKIYKTKDSPKNFKNNKYPNSKNTDSQSIETYDLSDNFKTTKTENSFIDDSISDIEDRYKTIKAYKPKNHRTTNHIKVTTNKYNVKDREQTVKSKNRFKTKHRYETTKAKKRKSSFITLYPEAIDYSRGYRKEKRKKESTTYRTYLQTLWRKIVRNEDDDDDIILQRAKSPVKSVKKSTFDDRTRNEKSVNRFRSRDEPNEYKPINHKTEEKRTTETAEFVTITTKDLSPEGLSIESFVRPQSKLYPSRKSNVNDTLSIINQTNINSNVIKRIDDLEREIKEVKHKIVSQTTEVDKTMKIDDEINEILPQETLEFWKGTTKQFSNFKPTTKEYTTHKISNNTTRRAVEITKMTETTKTTPEIVLRASYVRKENISNSTDSENNTDNIENSTYAVLPKHFNETKAVEDDFEDNISKFNLTSKEFDIEKLLNHTNVIGTDKNDKIREKIMKDMEIVYGVNNSTTMTSFKEFSDPFKDLDDAVDLL